MNAFERAAALARRRLGRALTAGEQSKLQRRVEQVLGVTPDPDAGAREDLAALRQRAAREQARADFESARKLP